MDNIRLEILDAAEPGYGVDNDAFLFEVFAANQIPVLQASGLARDELQELLSVQFRARQAQYHARYPDAEWAIVSRAGRRIGYRCVARNVDAIILVDVALLPEYQGRGIGTRLLQPLLDEADAARLPVSAHVEEANPARRLYARLGFETVASDGAHLAIRREPARHD